MSLLRRQEACQPFHGLSGFRLTSSSDDDFYGSAEHLRMIDRAARDRLADLFKGYACGTLVDIEPLERLETELCDCPDEGVAAALHAHRSIDDPRLEIEYMNESDRIDLLRCASFLRTDLKYEWPESPFERSSHADAVGLVVGCGAALLWAIFWVYFFYIPFDWLYGALAAPFVYLIFQVWVAGSISDRAVAAQIERHLMAGRDFEVWPYCRRGDVPPELLDEAVLAAEESA